MTTITVNVVHTLDPTVLGLLNGFFAKISMPAAVPQTAVAPSTQSVQEPTQPPAVTPSIQPPPMQQAPSSPTPSTVPTTDRTYTIDELARAGAALMDAGKGADALAVMQQLGIQRVTDLQPEQYALFAAALRGLGAKI